MRKPLIFAWLPLLAVQGGTGSAQAMSLDDARTLVDQGRLDEAIRRLEAETDENPAYEAARVLLAETYEKAGMLDEAVSTLKEVINLSNNESRLHAARIAISRIRRRQLDRLELEDSKSAASMTDPFKIPMPEIQWEGLEKAEDTDYLPPILPEPMNAEVPPFPYETEHFTVYSTNERLSKVVGDRAEIYLEYMLEKLFGGRAWAVRFPIVVYRDVQDYGQHGGPAGSGGVTMGHVTGKTEAILFFQLAPQWEQGQSGRGGSRSSSNQIYKYGIESVLPHELTHAVINEFFGGQETPRWLHEAVAGRFEQTRDHYGEAARLARSVVAGEYFRMRDLFEQKVYPERISLFYEQSAAVVLYLFEAGPEAMHVFLSELRAGNGHDAACAAALGIPAENAVEEFERRWVQWMRHRYLLDLDRKADDTDVAEAKVSKHEFFRPAVNELETVAQIEDWRKIEPASLDAFRGVGKAKEQWSAEGGALRCTLPGQDEPSTLAIRMNETAPAAVSAEVRFLGGPDAMHRSFGFVQLDADGYDTPVRALAPLPDNSPHTVLCVWLDDLAVYLDGNCVGRFPANQVTGDARDVDFPIGLMTYGPVEVQSLKVARIKSFSDKPVAVEADEERRPGRDQQPDRRRRRSTEPP
jgi:tetratricopeptide (TPR) repeat protein